MKSIFNNTVRVAACGCRRKSKTPFCCIIPPANRLAISAPCVCVTASSLHNANLPSSMRRQPGRSIDGCAKYPADRDARWFLSSTMPNIIMPDSTENGAICRNRTFVCSSCRPTAPTSIQLNGSGNSFAASACIIAISLNCRSSCKPWKPSSPVGALEVSLSSNFVLFPNMRKNICRYV